MTAHRPALTSVSAVFRALAPALVLGAMLVLPSREAGAVPLLLTVNSTNDPGDGTCNVAECTLREAITEANASNDPDIEFNIPTSDPGYDALDETWRIVPLGALPPIEQPTRINATTQPGYNGTPVIILDGSSAPGVDAFQIVAEDSAIRGFAINFYTNGAGVHVLRTTPGSNEGDRAVIESNYIGLGVDGVSDYGNAQGVIVDSSDDVRIGGNTAAQRNVISGNDNEGVLLRGNGGDPATGALVEGNYIGTDADGTGTVPNSGHGVSLEASAFNDIGGNTSGERNVISGNLLAGIHLVDSGSNYITGNFIGTDKTGQNALPNAAGVEFISSTDNQLGSTSSGERNVISGNTGSGVVLSEGADDNTISGNYIGVGADGSSALPNASGYVQDSSARATISRNIISGNLFTGISMFNQGTRDSVIYGNYIGTAADGETALGNGSNGIIVGGTGPNVIGGTGPNEPNTIAYNGDNGVEIRLLIIVSHRKLVSGNSIHDNGGLGIDLEGDGVTSNDPQDPDDGGNALQNYPELTSATTAGGITVAGTLNSTPSRDFRIEFFSNVDCDPSTYGEGQTYLGFTEVTTDGNGDADIAFHSSTGVPSGSSITATAINSDTNDTSEFSRCVAVVEAPDQFAWGDWNCSGVAHATDALDGLRYVAGIGVGPLGVTEPCPDIGAPVAVEGFGGQVWGDTDCDGAVTAADSTAILTYVAAVPIPPNTPPCPDIGQVVTVEVLQ